MNHVAATVTDRPSGLGRDARSPFGSRHATQSVANCLAVPASGACSGVAIAPESPDEIAPRIERAVSVFGTERVLLTPDCGFATFADNPITSERVAEQTLSAIHHAVARVG